MTARIREYLDRVPEGYSEIYYKGAKYGLTMESFGQGRSFKLYAHRLGGTDFVSTNVYLTSRSDLLKPCEMPLEKVLDFLQNLQFEKPLRNYTINESNDDAQLE